MIEIFNITLITTPFFPTYSTPLCYLVTRYLNNIRNLITSFQAWSPSDSVAKWLTHQTSERAVCSSNSPGGKCFNNSKKEHVPYGFHTWIICVEVRYPYHIINMSDWARGKKVDGEWFMKLMRFDKKICRKNLKKKKNSKKVWVGIF